MKSTKKIKRKTAISDVRQDINVSNIEGLDFCYDDNNHCVAFSISRAGRKFVFASEFDDVVKFFSSLDTQSSFERVINVHGNIDIVKGLFKANYAIFFIDSVEFVEA